MPKEINPEEILSVMEKLNKLPNCKHCKNNTKAEKPLSEMVQIELTPQLEQVLDSSAQKLALKEKSCLICLGLESFMKLPKQQQLDWLRTRA